MIGFIPKAKSGEKKVCYKLTFTIFCLIGCVLVEKNKGPVPINENEMAELVNVPSLKQDLQKGLDQLKNDYVKHLSLRSAAGSL